MEPGGTVVIGSGETVVVGPGGYAGHSGFIGPVTVAPGTEPVPPAPAPQPELLSLVAAPGLSETSGIPPQLNVDALLDALLSSAD